MTKNIWCVCKGKWMCYIKSQRENMDYEIMASNHADFENRGSERFAPKAIVQLGSIAISIIAIIIIIS